MAISNIPILNHNYAIIIFDENSSIVYSNYKAEMLRSKNSEFRVFLSSLTNKGQVVDNNKSQKTNFPINYRYSLNGLELDVVKDEFTINDTKLTIITFAEVQNQKSIQSRIDSEKFKTDFISNISHEFRTPLNAILGYTEILMNEIQNEQQLNKLKIIKDNSKSLLTLVNDLIILSKIQSDNLYIEKDDCDLSGLLDEIFNIYRYQLNNKGLKFEIEYNQFLNIKLKIDEVVLRQILINLIGNAIKFTDDGSVIASIEYYPIDNKLVNVIINIIDTGIGIDDKYKTRLFDLFSQANESNSKMFGGAGLGLAIVSRLVSKLGGELSFKSKLHEGTTFSIKFFNLEYHKKPDRGSNHEIIKFENFLRNIKKILIVDDSVNTRNELISIIGNETIKFFEADNAESVFFMASEIKPDLIIMDLRMSGMGGIETATHLKLNKSTRDIPILGLSSLHQKIKAQDERVYFHDIIDKPILWEELFETLSNIDNQVANQLTNISDNND